MATTVDASIPLGIKTPTLQDAMANMSSLLGVQQQQQDLQKGQETLSQGRVKTQQDQNTLREQQALGQINTRDYVDPNTGIIDADRYMRDAMAATPITGLGADHATAIYRAQRAQTEVSQAGQDLNRSIRSDVASRFSALSTDPNTTLNDYVKTGEQIKKDNPQAAKLVDSYMQSLPQQADMDTLHRVAGSLNRAVLPAGDNVSKPGSMDTGASIQPGTTNPGTGAFTAAGAPIKKDIPPGYQMINGQLVRADNSGLSLPTVRGGQGAPGAPPGAGAAPPQGAKLRAIPAPGVNANPGDVSRYNATMEENRKHIQDVSGAANDLQNGVGPTRYRNDQIQDILNSKTFSPTGPGAAQLNWISSKIPGGDAGDAYQKIGHYLAQNSAAIAQKMGVPGTNMGAEQAAAAAGNTAQNRGALLEVTKVNDAMNTALDMYNRGLAKASGNGADPTKVNAYKQAFGQNFDMNVLRYEDALRRNDRDEIDRIQKEQGTAGMKAMGAKRRVLRSLADTGDLP